MLRATVATVACAIAMTSLAPAAVSSAKSGPDRALDRALAALVASPGGPPGAIAIVQRGDERRVHAAGVAALGRRAPRPTDRMRIASVSKAFSGAAALRLVSRGRLSLDETIGSRLPGLPAAWHPVTLRQLLNHTSGLPDYSASEGFAKALNASPKAAPPPAELLSYVASEPLRFPPGSAYRYSNSDNVVIGLMVEAATGSPYPAALRSLVYRPLGLGSTLLPTGAGFPSPRIHGYALPERGDPEDVTTEVAFGGWAWASGGIVSTPADLNRFVRGYVGGALFEGVARSDQRRFVRGHSEPAGPGKNSAGLALFRYQTRCGTVLGHTGSVLGYTQLIAANANGRRSVTFTINVQASDELVPRLRRAQVAAVCAALRG